MSLTEEIKKLKSLLEEGAISKEEYDKLLKQVMEDFIGVQVISYQAEDESPKKESKESLDDENREKNQNNKDKVNQKLRCPKCNKEFPVGVRFCDSDGTKLVSSESLVRRCIKCGTEYSKDVKFCPKDGGIVATQSTLEKDNRKNFSDLELPKAPLEKRFLAYILDGIVASLLAIPAILVYINGITKLVKSSGDATFTFIISVLLSFLPIVYSLLKDGLGKGQSIGKRAVGLKVIDLNDNTSCNFKQSFIRNIMFVLFGLIFLIGAFIEPVIVLISEDGRRVGDKVANTHVIESV